MNANTCLGEVERCRFGAVIVVTIHVEDLLTLDREQSREDTLGQAGAENDDLQQVRQNTRKNAINARRIPHPWWCKCGVVVMGVEGSRHVIYSAYERHVA